MLWSLFILALVTHTVSYESRIICYYTNWAQYRPGKGKYFPDDVDPNLCTIISYAFAKPVGLDLKPFEWNDDDTTWAKGMYNRILNLKNQNPRLKVILAVGGFNMGSGPFIPLIQTTASRQTFTQNTIKFLRARNFDGFDMDWEYPTRFGSLPSDKPKFQLLMEELWNAFQQEALSSGQVRLLLGVAVGVGKSVIDEAYYVANLSRCTDFISLMTYDFHGGWENFVGFNSPLYAYITETGPSRYLNVDWATKYYISLGAPKEKLNVGIATYGRTFTLAARQIHSINSPAISTGLPGPFTRLEGILAYYEICDFIKNGGMVVDVESQSNPYAVKDTQWVGYDDPKSATEKACYAVKSGIGGVLIWTMDFDDFRGEFCNEGKNPLLTSIVKAVTNPGRWCSCLTNTKAGSMLDGTKGLQHIDVRLFLVEIVLLWPVLVI